MSEKYIPCEDNEYADVLDEGTSLGDRIEELLEFSLINAVCKGLSVAATIIFTFLALVIGVVALGDGISWYWGVLFFIVFGLIGGVSGGFSYYLFEEY